MAPKRERNAYLETPDDDESDYATGSEGGYDSEAAEAGLRKARVGASGDIKGGSKRRKITSEDEEDEESDIGSEIDDEELQDSRTAATGGTVADVAQEDEDTADAEAPIKPTDEESTHAAPAPHKSSKSNAVTKTTRPGIIYLPSLPPHLKPSALRHLLEQRGFEPINRLFLTPAKASNGSKSRARKNYGEAWIEFASHKTAKKCVEALNANSIGGPKRGYYHDDLWNMRYLRGMTWMDLMGQIREERREEEVRKHEERRKVRGEVEQFLQGVEKSKKQRTAEEKGKRRKGADTAGPQSSTERPGRSKFEWKQYEVKKSDGKQGAATMAGVDTHTKRVLGKIF